jgi:hypothetical protein
MKVRNFSRILLVVILIATQGLLGMNQSKKNELKVPPRAKKVAFGTLGVLGAIALGALLLHNFSTNNEVEIRDEYNFELKYFQRGSMLDPKNIPVLLQRNSLLNNHNTKLLEGFIAHINTRFDSLGPEKYYLILKNMIGYLKFLPKSEVKQ